MSTQVINGLSVEITGQGSAVLCIHGLGGSSNVWSPLLPALEGRQVIRFDLPGSGRSALGKSPLSIDVFVEAVEVVLNNLDVEKVDILAHSMGTIVAAHFAAKHPEKVASLALFGPLLAPPDAGRDGIRARAKHAAEGVHAIQEIADAIVQGATSRETKLEQPAVTAFVREFIMRQTPEGYSQSCAALAEAQPADVTKLNMPVLLVTGDQDGVAPPANVKAYGERLENAHVVVFEGCGHWTPLEKPQDCIKELNNFYAVM
ncbi:alpha/beta fold hydrolase [Pseudomonas shirazensis]|uniref:alpha/beta fold hydrolase n=1 Tax=Pseudomonas shirazensis TaxID=2745494 RepID=UPI003D27C956